MAPDLAPSTDLQKLQTKFPHRDTEALDTTGSHHSSMGYQTDEEELATLKGNPAPKNNSTSTQGSGSHTSDSDRHIRDNDGNLYQRDAASTAAWNIAYHFGRVDHRMPSNIPAPTDPEPSPSSSDDDSTYHTAYSSSSHIHPVFDSDSDSDSDCSEGNAPKATTGKPLQPGPPNKDTEDLATSPAPAQNPTHPTITTGPLSPLEPDTTSTAAPLRTTAQTKTLILKRKKKKWRRTNPHPMTKQTKPAEIQTDQDQTPEQMLMTRQVQKTQMLTS